MKKQNILSKRYSIQVIGDCKDMSEFDKSILNKKLIKFVEGYKDKFSQRLLTIDIKHKKGNHNSGKYRGIPLYYTRLRFSTDKGIFIAKKENWGIHQSLNSALNIIKQKIYNTTKKNYKKEKIHEIIDYNIATET